jgi:hypothetical protein
MTSVGRLAHLTAALAIACAASLAGGAGSASAGSIAVSGDSISRGFNTGICDFGDHPERTWATGDDHGTNLCDGGPTGTFSHAERLECSAGATVPAFNVAISGDSVVAGIFNPSGMGFAGQAGEIRSDLAGAPALRYVTVFLGHNDADTNVLDKTGNTCEAPTADRDPDNYCRATDTAFEREFRRGLDELIQIPGSRILILGLLRFSQICNFGTMALCGSGGATTCTEYWPSFPAFQSLLHDCSAQRRIDAYQTLAGYDVIIAQVTAEYAAIPPGGTSANGAVKAADVQLMHTDAPSHLKLTAGDLSCCDCVHPSDQLQEKLADIAWRGLQCSAAMPCCADTGDPLDDATCATDDTTTFYGSGFFSCSGDAQCDDGDPATADTCDTASGVCRHRIDPCVTLPSSCAAAAPSKASIALKAKGPSLKWKWSSAAAVDQADFGDPASPSGAGFTLCLIDGSATVRRSFRAPPAGVCDGKPCWAATSTGFKYGAKSGTPDGVIKLGLKGGAAGKATIGIAGKGANLVLPGLPITALPVRAVLVRDDGALCWDARFSNPTHDDTSAFQAKSD